MIQSMSGNDTIGKALLEFEERFALQGDFLFAHLFNGDDFSQHITNNRVLSQHHIFTGHKTESGFPRMEGYKLVTAFDGIIAEL
jgi:hypothetical protein